MFIDTSAIVAVLNKEADATEIVARIDRATQRITAPHVKLESVMVLANRLDIEPLAMAPALDTFFADAKVSVVPIDDETAKLAVEAFARYGKGRGSKAQLNFGDCLSYAAAKKAQVPILFVGDDFNHTDLTAA